MRKIYSLLLALFAVCGLASANVITVTPTDVSGSQDGIVFESDKADGGTVPAYNANGLDVRIYAKGTFTVASTNGNMSQIVFHISTQGKKRLTSITPNVGQVAAQAVGDETVTWTGDASRVIFTVGEKAIYGSDGESKAGQFDFTSFDVTVGAADPNYVAAPTFSPAPGTYYEPFAVTISAGEGCSIWYTTDGNSPVDATGMLTDFAQRYEAPFMVNETTTIQAIAVKDVATAFLASEVVTATYTIDEAVMYTSIPRMKAAAQTLAQNEKQACEMNTNGLTVIGVKDKNLYVVDYTGEGILLYGNNTMNLVVGDMIGGTIKGKLQLYNGAAELGDVDFSGMTLNQQGIAVEPTAATIAELTGNNRLRYESGLVKVSDLTFDATALSSKNITAKDVTGAEITIRDNYGVLADYPFSTTATYDVTAIVAYYNGAVQLYPRTADDVVKVSGGDDPDPDQPHQLVGDGLSMATAYTVEDLNSFDITAKTDTIQKEAWVKAQILGYVNGSTFKAETVVFGSDMSNLETKVASNIVIIDEANNSVVAAPEIKFAAPVNLTTSPTAAKKVREALNLADNPNNVGLTVWLNGTITQYLGVNGLKEVKKYSLDGTNVLPSADEPGPDPGTEIDWTSSADAPLTVAQAVEKGGQLAPKADSGKDVYVKGFVSSVEEIASGSAKYYIADQMAGSTTQLYIYKGKGLNGADIADGGLTQGDAVVVVGKIKNYQQTDGSCILEMTGSKLYSLNGQTTGGDDPQPEVEYAASGSGTLADPYNADAVRAFNIESTSETDKTEIWVKGIIYGYINGSTLKDETAMATSNAPEGNDNQGNPLTVTKSNILIYDAQHATATGTAVAYLVPVNLPNGAVREALNLGDNPNNLGREVWLCGDALKYMGVTGLKNVKKYSFDGRTVQPGGDEPGPEPGTDIDWTSSVDAPLTVAAVMEKSAGLAANAKSGVEVYVKGIITEVKEISTQYGNATYMIADHAAGDANQLEVFRGKYFNGEDFSAEDQLAVGDEVVVLGQIQHYVKSDGSEDKIEVAQGNKLISQNGQTGPSTPVETVAYENLPQMRAAAHELGTAKQACELNTNGLTIIGVKGKQIWAVDYTREGGIMLYGDNTLNLTVGQTIGGTIKGKLQLYNGVAELGDVDYSDMSVLPAAETIEPVEATIAEITSNTIKYESGLVIVKGLNFGEATAFAQNTTAYDDSDNEIVLRDNFGTYTNQAITVGEDYDVTAIVTLYNDVPQLYPRSMDDIIKSGEANLQTPTSEWSADNVFCGPGEVVNVQFSTNSDGAVTFTSSDESVAVVDAQGVITAVGAGTATITATTAATATYRSSSDWVNVIVTAAAQTVDDVLASWDGETKIANTTVRGFIVGYVNGQSYQNGAVFFRTRNAAPATRADDEISNTNLLIATDKDETDVAKCMPVQLPAGNVRESLNLRDHSELAFAEVELYGDVDKYFGVCGLKGVSAFRILGVDDAVRGIAADIVRDAAIYTLDGRRVSSITRAGIYVVGGRKVVVK